MNGIGNEHVAAAAIPGVASEFVNVNFNTSFNPDMFAGS